MFDIVSNSEPSLVEMANHVRNLENEVSEWRSVDIISTVKQEKLIVKMLKDVLFCCKN